MRFQSVGDLTVQLPADLAGATNVVLETHLRIGAATAAGNSWRIPDAAFPKPPAARACEVDVFAEANLLDSARLVCSTPKTISAGAFTPPGMPFVVLTNELRSDVADAAQRLGGTALIFNPSSEGQFPVCAVSDIGVIPPPFQHLLL